MSYYTIFILYCSTFDINKNSGTVFIGRQNLSNGKILVKLGNAEMSETGIERKNTLGYQKANDLFQIVMKFTVN